MELPVEPSCEFWQDLSYPDKVKKLLDEGYLADCKFVVEPNKEATETIFGHKLMFILESPVFEKLFNGNFSEGKIMPEVHIEEFYPKDFKNFCFLIYCHNTQRCSKLFTKFSTIEIIEIYRICHKYMVTSLLRKCLDYIQSILCSISVADIILLYELGNELNEKLLLTPVEKAIITRNVLFDEGLNDLSPEIFYNYIVFLNTFQTKPSAVKMFNAIYSYFTVNNLLDKENKKTLQKNKEKKADDREICISKFLKFIDFNKMTAEEFAEGPGESELLDWKLKYNILSKLVMKPKRCY